MTQTRVLPSKIRYVFTRVKDSFEENGTIFISFSARLTREYPHAGFTENERIWFDFQELKKCHANCKMSGLREGISTYLLSEEVFEELVKLSSHCPKELYHITPIFEDTYFKKLAKYG
ncbi:hypothetical protein [Jeotgalibacillus campisalis]|uniref:Uncharacterized protein n=1 Tax=Jeotgalibacillus campisalis TaxID=220754 RepID=A0A0C2W336_9BACL|nr:hypothetical protein [Jeotgalibacillus campisalis]KIL51026.1 hypothetical protein KR50_09070 [Jeotgalibacillus campisalis]